MSEEPFSNPWDNESPIDRKARLDNCLAAMRAISNRFYGAAVHLNNHTFIEFTGLINEYILVCQEHADKGIDFTRLSAHGGRTLELKSFQVEYLQEKLTCIFGPQWKTNPAENAAEVRLKALRSLRTLTQMVDEDGE